LPQHSSDDRSEDAAFFLYLVPIAASIIYGVYEWYHFGPKSHSMPGLAYVVVSKDPYLFLGSLAAVCLGFILELRGTPINERTNAISANSKRMQILAIIVLVISYAAGISAGGYSLANGTSNFLIGRYALIFAFFLIGLSVVIAPKQILGNVKIGVVPEFIGLLLMAASPFLYYGATKLKLPFSAAASVGIIVLIIGVAVLVVGPRILKKPTKAVEKANLARTPVS
jgi:hypothetical protein